MKKVCIDISALDPNFKEHSTRGIGKYARKFINYLEKNHLEDEFAYFNHAELLADSNLAKLIDHAPCGRQTLKQQILYPTKLKQINSAKYLHFLAQTDAPSYCSKPYIVTAMDLIPVVCQDLYNKKGSKGLRYHLARYLELKAIQNANQVLTISECSKQDFIKHLGIDPEKIKVIYLGVDQEYFQPTQIAKPKLLEDLGLTQVQNFLLYVGGIDPRKNLKGLVRIYAKLKEIYQEKGKLADLPKLLLVGRISQDDQYPKLKELIKNLALEDDILETGYVSDQQLYALYQHAGALCFTSLYEGFGLTPLEAMAAGTAVFCHKLSAIPEVVGDAAFYLPQDDNEASAKIIFETLNDAEALASAKSKGQKQAAKFSWDKTWEETIDFYYNLV